MPTMQTVLLFTANKYPGSMYSFNMHAAASHLMTETCEQYITINLLYKFLTSKLSQYNVTFVRI